MLAHIFASKYLHIMKTRRDVFQAIADPTRREIINLIAGSPKNLNAIAENFDVTRQAISLHIKILAECGLIVVRQEGRERFCEARLEKLNEVHEWTEQYRVFWTKKLHSLKMFLEEESKEISKTKGKRKIIALKKTKRK